MVDEPIVMREVREEGSFDAFFGDRFAELSRLAFLLTGSSGVTDEIAQDACEQVFRRWRIAARGPMRQCGGGQRCQGVGAASFSPGDEC